MSGAMLPPLPMAIRCCNSAIDINYARDHYTADQMRDYALAAIAALTPPEAAQAEAVDIRYEEVLKVVQARGFDTVADLIDAWDRRHNTIDAALIEEAAP